MADVVVSLSLKRKSGILAAAISTLARAGLEFQTHRFSKASNDGSFQLELLAAGDLGEAGALSGELSRIRGVRDVIDISVDGRSALGAGRASSSGVLDASGMAEIYDALQSAPEAEIESRTEPEAAVESESEPAPEPEPERKPEPRKKPGAGKAAASEPETSDGQKRAYMSRRRRRRR